MIAGNLNLPARYSEEDLAYSLTPLESLRVSACLDEAVDKLAFLNTLTPDVLAHRDELATLVGDEITTLIQEQKALEKEFEMLVQQQHAMKNTSNPTEMKNVTEKISKVSAQLQEKTTVLCRNLRDSPNISENILKIQTERVALQSLLQRTIRDLSEHLYVTMGKSVAEDKQKADKLAMAEENEKQAATEISKMKEQLSKMRADYKRVEEMLNTVIAKKREELRVLRASRYEEQSLQPTTEAKLQSLKRVMDEEEEEWEKKNMVLQQRCVTIFLLLFFFLFISF